MDPLFLLKWSYKKLCAKRRDNYIRGLVEKGLKIGKNVEIIESFFFDPSHCFLISIGDNCTICPNVRIIAHDASTKNALGYTKIKTVRIMDNCFIGDSTLILPGVVIGPNAIVGAGSVITKNVPPDSVVAGNPARFIRSYESYIEDMRKLSRDKKIFSEEYYIERLDDEKRAEIIRATTDKFGFIV